MSTPLHNLYLVHNQIFLIYKFLVVQSMYQLHLHDAPRWVPTRPVQQAVSGRLGPILRELNGSTCWTVPAHLKDEPSRAGPWTPTDWPGMAHKPSGLAVPAGRANRPCPAGRASGLAHIKFCFVIKSNFFKKNYI